MRGAIREDRPYRARRDLRATMSRQPHKDLFTSDTDTSIVVARGKESCTFLGRKNEYKSSVDQEFFLSFGSMKSSKPLISFRFTLRSI